MIVSEGGNAYSDRRVLEEEEARNVGMVDMLRKLTPENIEAIENRRL